MDKLIAVSGGFDPLHSGHLAMFKDAAKQGSVVAILNTDAWLKRKKGFVFLPFEERAAILRELRCVDVVVPADDEDGTVATTLKWLRPHAFANGGDRGIDTTPEKEACETLGIEQIYGVGGCKINSSSMIARQAWVERPWGRYKTVHEGVDFKVKELILSPGKGISLQTHNHRAEFWVVIQGRARVINGDREYTLLGGESVHIKPTVKHKISNPTNHEINIIEVQRGYYLGEDDIERYKEEIPE